MKNINRHCPICESKNLSKLCNVSFCDNKNFTGLPDEYTITECNECGMVFSNMDATEKDFTDYYENFSTYLEKTNENCRRVLENEYAILYNMIQPYITENSKIMDIGTAKGGFLDYLNKKGLKNLYGIEPSIEDNKDNTLEDNIRLIKGDICQKLNITEKFDLINLQQVMEHIYNVKTALQNIKNLVRDNGYLLIDVPNADKYIDNYNVPYEFFIYEHINHFNKASLTNLLAENDFKIINVMYHNRIHYPNICILAQKQKNNIELKFANNDKIKEYISISKQNIDKTIKPYINNQEPLIIWGAAGKIGLLILGLGLKNANIIQIIDSSNAKIGKTLMGTKISSPEEIKNSDATILILSDVFKNEIIQYIKKIGLKNKIECLYK